MAKAPVLTPQSVDFPQWYQDVINKAELAENGPVRGTMVIRPYAYAIWERMQAAVDQRIKEAGAENVSFPMFIPESYLHREAQHVEGFSPELAVVTIAGGKELEEPVVVRPTSETVVGEYMAKWIQSYRDLPLLLNLWNSVVRWEKRPRIFLRTTEFLWQEGHCAHATQEDAARYARQILDEVYADFMVKELAIPVIRGRKPTSERFAGAINTLTCEAMMGDGKALQMGTSHELGQNFSRAFQIEYLDADSAQHLCWTTSWGVSTRMMGGLIMAHGDDLGLRIPPRIAAVQIVLLVVRDDDEGSVAAEAQRLASELRDAGLRCKVDAATHVGFGRRATAWELRGVPVRIELGPRDLDAGVATIARRDSAEKATVPAGGLGVRLAELLTEIQDGMLAAATARRDSRMTGVETVADAVAASQDGFASIEWAKLGDSGEAELRKDAITVRCLLDVDGDVATSEDAAGNIAVVGRSY